MIASSDGQERMGGAYVAEILKIKNSAYICMQQMYALLNLSGQSNNIIIFVL